MVTEEKVLRTARVFVPGPVQTRACRQGLEGDGVERIELELETHGREVPADTETRLLYGLSDNLTSDTPITTIQGYRLNTGKPGVCHFIPFPFHFTLIMSEIKQSVCWACLCLHDPLGLS